MTNKAILFVACMNLITIKTASANCPREITGDEFDSLIKRQEIAGDDGNSRYLKSYLTPKNATVKHNETLEKTYQEDEPTTCSYTRGQVTVLYLTKK